MPRRVVRRGRQTRVQAVSLPSPYGGWNTRDSLDAMPATDAIVLDNWIPDLGRVKARAGHTGFVTTGMGSGAVEALMGIVAPGVTKLLAATNSNLYEISSGVAASIGSGFGSNRWQHVVFNNQLVMVNGADTPQQYDGTTLTGMSWSGSGLTPSALDGVNVFKERLYFWDSGTASFWYAPVDSLSGTLTEFPLGNLGVSGGQLLCMGTWTIDKGDGVDDLAVFVMTTGEVFVYTGDDPGSNFSLLGLYRISRPISIRGIAKVGGDLMITTETDYASMTNELRGAGQPSKLSGAVSDVSSSRKDLFGWQSTLHQDGRLLILNVPITSTTSEQHVINTKTGGACRFTGINALCWESFAGTLYFGGASGDVYRYTGRNDDGSAIFLDGQQAWNAFGSPNRKRVSATRAVVEVEGSATLETGVGYDFDQVATPNAITNSLNASFWDVALWDVALWSDENLVNQLWTLASGSGQSVSFRLKASALQEMSWLRTDMRLESGSNL